VAETLEKQLSTSAIYGGDLAPILSIITSTFARIKTEEENDVVSIDDKDDQVRFPSINVRKTFPSLHQ